MERFVAVVGCCFFLAACVTTDSGVNALGASMSEIQAMPLEEAKAHLAGKTVITFIDRHELCENPNLNALGYCKWVEGPGTQVEYFAEDGRWFLWSPGNAELATGTWTLRSWQRSDRYQVCFASSGTVTNVLARYPQEDDFKCALLVEYAGKITEARKADSFALSSGRMPFPLSKESTTVDALLKSL